MSRSVTSRRASFALALAAALMASSALVTPAAVAATGESEASARFMNDAREQIKKGDLNAAVIQLKNAIQRQPDNAEARKLLGEIYLRLGQGPAAEKELRAAIATGTPDRSLPVLLGQSLLMQRKFDDVLQEISDDTVDPEMRADSLVLRGRAYQALGQQEDAQKAYAEAARLRPNDANLRVGQAQLLLSQGKLSEAEQEVDAAIAAKPDTVEAYVIKGEIRRLNRDNIAALDNFTKALQHNGAHVGARVGKASVLIDLNRVDEAQREIDEVLKRQARNPAASYLQALIFARKGEFQRAQDFLNQGGSALDDHLPSQFLRGIVAYQLNQLEQAELSLSRYMTAIPGNIRAAKILAAVHLRKNEPQRTINLLKPLEAALEKDPQGLSLLAAAYMRTGRFADGTTYYEKAAEISPDSAGIRTQLAMSRLATGQAQSAEDELEKALELNPDASQTALMLGLVQLRNRDFDSAVETAKKLQDKQKDNPVAYNLLGAALLGKGDRPAAREAWRQAIKLKSDFHPARLNIAQLDLAEGKSDEATKEYEEVLRQAPNHVGAMLALSEIAQRQDKRREAMDWLQKAMTADPKAVAPPLRLAMLHANSNNTERALAIVREADRNIPNEPRVIEVLGRIEMAAKQPDAAIATFNRLVQIMPTSAQAREFLARAQIEAKDPVSARTTLNRAIEIDPSYFPTYNVLFGLEVQERDFEAARKVANKMREIRPELGVGDMLIGDLMMQEKKPAEALKFYNDGLKRENSAVLAVRRFQALRAMQKTDEGLAGLKTWLDKNDDRGVRFTLSSAYIEAGRTDDAIRETERLIATDGNNPVLLNNLAWLYHQKKDPRALSFAEKAYQEAPQSANIVDTLGWILVETGEVKRGLDLISKAYNLNPNSGEIHYHYAIALNKAGQKDEARRELERLVSSGRPFAQAYEARALLRELSKGG